MSVEDFRKRLEIGKQRLLETERIELKVARTHLQNAIETEGTPFFEVLLKSKIITYLEELAQDHPDMRLNIFLYFFGKDYSHSARLETIGKLQWSEEYLEDIKEAELNHTLIGSLPLYEGDRFHWLEGEVNRWDHLGEFLRKNRFPLINVDQLEISFTWDYQEETGDFKEIYPFKIEKQGDDYYITIGKNILWPNDWKEPNKVQSAIIGEYLKAEFE